MKNLTGRPISIQRDDESRITIQPEAATPVIAVQHEELPLGTLNGIDVIAAEQKAILWNGLNINSFDQPFIVTQEIFDLLPHDATEFVTPDLGPSAIRNAFGGVQAITRLIAKPAARKYVPPQPIDNQQ